MIEGIFTTFEENLNKLYTKLCQNCFHQGQFEVDLGQSRAVVPHHEKVLDFQKIKTMGEEFQKIKEILKKKLEFERRTLHRLIDNSEGSLRNQFTKTMDKSMMATEPHQKILTQQKLNELAEIGRIKVEVRAKKVACKLSAQRTSCAHICFKGKNSYLSIGNKYGLSVKKGGKFVYSKNLADYMVYLGEAVYCKGAYYIYNHSPGRILRKGEDSSDPIVWWDKQKIKSVWMFNQNLRVNPENTFLIVNVNETDLVVIEVKEDGEAGREIMIENQTGARICSHEVLKEGRILTVNEKGLPRIYQVDYSEFSKPKVLKSSQIAPSRDGKENHFWVAVCEKSQICAVRLNFISGRSSRILIYRLRNEAGEAELTFQTEINLNFHGFIDLTAGCFSPYVGDNLVLCAHAHSNHTAYAYGYDLKKNKLTQVHSEVVGKGLNPYCWKLSRVGNRVCGILANGGLILQFKFSLYSVVVPI